MQSSLKEYPIPDTLLYQIFYHELLHWIFFLLGEEHLREDEKLIDQIANLLSQALGGKFK